MSLGAYLAAVCKAVLLPPACVLLLYAAGLLVARRRPVTGRRICHGAASLLFVLSSGVGAWLLARPLELLEPALDAAMMARAQPQAIVVLSAGRIKQSPEYSGRSVPDFVALERMTYSAGLARSTGLPLLVTGGQVSRDSDDEALALGMKRVFESAFGLPVRWVEAGSTNTAENAGFSAAMLKRDGVNRIVLVTDAMHMRRARIAFEREGMVVTPGPTFYATSRGFDPSELIPTAGNLWRSYYAIYEWFGLAWYMLKSSG